MENKIIEYLDASQLELSLNESGFCQMKYQDKLYKRVNLLKACPQTEPYRFVSVEDMNTNEIGIIKDLNELDENSKIVAINELDKRYFIPTITQFIDIKMKPGTTFFDCMFGDRRKSFIVKDVSHNVFYIEKDVARINDSDGNRYLVKINDLDKKSKKLIEPLLY